jgi:hypothetical protein
MRRRVPVVFWSATLVAVILLGVTWTLAQRALAGDASVEDDVLLAAGTGLAAASLVAGRIMVVVGRLRRRSSGGRQP